MFLLPGADTQKVIADCEEGVRLFNAKKYSEALVYLERSAKAGYGDALYYISLYYTNGILVEKNDYMGKAFYIEALFHNSPAIIREMNMFRYLDAASSWYVIYKYLMLQPSFDNALTSVKLEQSKQEMKGGNYYRAAACGNPDAMCAIGAGYRYDSIALRGCEEAKSACALRNQQY